MGVIKKYNPEIGPGFQAISPGQATAGIVGNSQTFNAVVSLTAAQIIGMFAAPITIIPAPGAGKAIIVDEIVVAITGTSTQFTGGGVIHFYYHGQTTELMAQTIAAATLTGATTALDPLQLEPVQTAGGSVVKANTGVDITNATGAFAAGTGTMKLFIRYRVVSL